MCWLFRRLHRRLRCAHKQISCGPSGRRLVDFIHIPCPESAPRFGPALGLTRKSNVPKVN